MAAPAAPAVPRLPAGAGGGGRWRAERRYAARRQAAGVEGGSGRTGAAGEGRGGRHGSRPGRRKVGRRPRSRAGASAARGACRSAPGVTSPGSAKASRWITWRSRNVLPGRVLRASAAGGRSRPRRAGEVVRRRRGRRRTGGRAERGGGGRLGRAARTARTARTSAGVADDVQIFQQRRGRVAGQHQASSTRNSGSTMAYCPGRATWPRMLNARPRASTTSTETCAFWMMFSTR